MGSNHTPGPWETKGLAIFAKGNGYRVADVPLPNRVFRGKEWHEEKKYSEANARLIAAAPELFDLLTRAQEELRLINMKDTGATYDITLRLEMSAALLKARPNSVTPAARDGGRMEVEGYSDA